MARRKPLPPGMSRRAYRKIDGKKRYVNIEKDYRGKEKLTIINKKSRMLDRTIYDIYGDATLTADQYNKYMDYYDWVMSRDPQNSDPDYEAWELLKKDYPDLRNEVGFDAVDNQKYPYKLRMDGTIMGYYKSEKEADRQADYISAKGQYYKDRKFKVEKVKL